MFTSRRSVRQTTQRRGCWMAKCNVKQRIQPYLHGSIAVAMSGGRCGAPNDACISFTAARLIAQFRARGRRRLCRNSRSRPTMNGRASTSSRESRNNLRRSPRFCRSSEAQARGPLIRFRTHSHCNKGSCNRSRNHSRACASGSSRSAYSGHGASHSAYSDADNTPARSVSVVS